MRGQDDGDAAFTQAPHHFPHAAAQLHVHARGGLVQEQDGRFMRQRLGDNDAALHAPGQRHDAAVLLVPQGQVAQHLFDVGGVGRLAKEATAERDGVPDAFERVGGNLLRHQADLGARGAEVRHDVVAVSQYAAIAGIDDAADDADQCR
ncbi:hypothetical protein G6F57_020419 [Rhizopus arrhizus]|nr:hypothetical protein G6F57_020419 [Rhizopus arrhizus]